MNIDNLKKLSIKARLAIIEKCNQIGGTHIGGSFSSIDFLICYYYMIHNKLNPNQRVLFYQGKIAFNAMLLISKGHCYISQLAALDTVFGGTFYLNEYFKPGTDYFGHPKRNSENFHFPASTGSLGQGVVYGNGLALGLKLKGINDCNIVSIIGDGEMQEGATFEALNFLIQHKLNHWVIMDNNNQISLGKSSDILNIGSVYKRLEGIDINSISLDGHDFKQICQLTKKITSPEKKNINGGFAELKTTKGSGVSFMEGVYKWHHRRFREGEFEAASEELKRKLKIAK